MTVTRVGPLFKWFGSKWQSAKHYPEPRHDIIVEPYAGGAGYSLNHCHKQVFIWEDDPNLLQLWQWLIDSATSSDILAVPVALPVGFDIRTLQLSSGQSLLLKHWQRTNNVGDCWTISPWGNLPGQWTENTRARVADQVHAIKHWIVRRPQLLTNIPATWFLDPPYIYNYRYRSTLPKFNYGDLTEMIDSLHYQSMVIACESIRKSDGAVPSYLPFSHSHRSVTSRRKATQSHHSSEVTWVRFPKSADPFEL